MKIYLYYCKHCHKEEFRKVSKCPKCKSGCNVVIDKYHRLISRETGSNPGNKKKRFYNKNKEHTQKHYGTKPHRKNKTKAQKVESRTKRHTWIPYPEYLQTGWWKFKRRQKLISVGSMCENNWCGSREKLQVHHLHYKTLWHERNSDLKVLCGNCHRHEHLSDIEMRNHLDSIVNAIPAVVKAAASKSIVESLFE